MSCDWQEVNIYHLHLDYQNNLSQDLMKVITDIIEIGNFEQQMSEEPI